MPALRDVALDPGNPLYFPLPSGSQARYAELTVYSDTGADVCVGEFRTYGPDAAASGMDFGTDLSFTPQELAAGATFSDDGRPGTPVTITRDAGANYVRMRLWVNPPPGYSDLASDLALARQVHAAGMKIYLDIMYSDFWADPQHQDIPAAWAGQDLTQLTATVQSYTQQVITAFARQGTPVDTGVDRERDQERHPVAGRRDQLHQLRRLGQPGPAAQGGRRRRRGGQPGRAQAAGHDALRPGRRQRAELGLLRRS